MGSECCKQPAVSDDSPLLQGGTSIKTTGDSETVKFLSKVKLFQRLPSDLLPVLATGCIQKDFAKGKEIIKQGDYGTEFYVIISGSVSVNIDGKKVTSFASGDYFGEVALLRDEPRTATITAEDAVQALMITRQKFQDMGLNEKLEFQKRQAVGGGAGERKLETKPPSTKTGADRQIISQAVKSNSFLSEMVSLDDSKIQMICDIAWEQTVESGQAIIEQGSDGDYFYMVKEGSFEIFINKSDAGKSAGDAEAAQAERVGTISKGSSFGELALLYFAPRAATVKAKQNSVVWVIDRDNFKTVLAKSADDFAKEHVKYLETKDVFSALKPDEKYEVAKALVDCNFSAGEVLFEQGEKGTSFYILTGGEVSVIKDGKEVAKLKGSPSKVEIFGELALINAENRAATVKAVSDIKTLTMDKASFDLLLGPLKEIQTRGKDGGPSKVGKGRASLINEEVAKKADSGICRQTENL
jgi:cAMP-dependent protein kinase regulator